MSTVPVAPALAPSHVAGSARTIYLGRALSTVRTSTWLLAEVVVVPSLVLFGFVHAGHDMAGLLTVAAWRLGCSALHLAAKGRVPATALLALGMFVARTAVSLLASSVAVYLWQPIGMSALMGLIFMTTAFGRRPLTLRLAGDFIDLPEDLADDVAIRRLFAQLTFWWGLVHLICAALGAWAMTLPEQGTVAVTGVLGIVCTVFSVAGCIGWGLWRVRRVGGIRLRWETAPTCPITTRPVCDRSGGSPSGRAKTTTLEVAA